MAKAIRIQIDMIYSVPDDEAQDIYDFDINFFQGIQKQMETWNLNEDEPRKLITQELRHHIGEYQNEEEE